MSGRNCANSIIACRACSWYEGQARRSGCRVVMRAWPLLREHSGWLGSREDSTGNMIRPLVEAALASAAAAGFSSRRVLTNAVLDAERINSCDDV